MRQIEGEHKCLERKVRSNLGADMAVLMRQHLQDAAYLDVRMEQ